MKQVDIEYETKLFLFDYNNYRNHSTSKMILGKVLKSSNKSEV